jgi:hypothetical protein
LEDGPLNRYGSPPDKMREPLLTPDMRFDASNVIETTGAEAPEELKPPQVPTDEGQQAGSDDKQSGADSSLPANGAGQ